MVKQNIYICFVLTAEFPVKAFLLNHLRALTEFYEVTVIVNTNNPNFVVRGQLYFAFMAMFSFIGRLILDVLKGVSLIAYPIIKIQDKEISTKWQNVLNFIGNGNR